VAPADGRGTAWQGATMTFDFPFRRVTMIRYFKKKKWVFCFVLLIYMPFLGNVFAIQENTTGETSDAFSGETSLPWMLEYATRNNPAIQAEMAKWRAVVEKYRVATAYPDPQLMVTWFPSPIETRLGPQDWNASLSQTIPFPGKLTTSGEMVKTDVTMAKFATDARVREVAARVTQSFHELTYIRKARQIATENATLLDKLRQMAETGHARDRTALIDVVKAQSQVGQLRYDILLLEELEQTETTLLNSLLNRPPDGRLGPLKSIPVTLVDISMDTLYALADANQEGIRIAGLKVEKAMQGVSLSQYSNKPDFKLGLFYAAIGNPGVPSPPRDAGNDAVGIQFGVNIPLWTGKNNGAIDMARAGVLQEKALLNEIKNQTHSTIRSLYFKLNNSKRLMTLYGDDLIPQALKALDISQEWFRNGQGSFSDVLEAQAAAYNFQLSLARARADYGKTLAQLQRLVGGHISPLSGASRTKEVDNG